MQAIESYNNHHTILNYTIILAVIITMISTLITASNANYCRIGKCINKAILL